MKKTTISKILVIGLCLSFVLTGIGIQRTQAVSTIDTTELIIPAGSPIQIAASIWGQFGNSQDFYEIVQMAIDDYGGINGFNIQLDKYFETCTEASGQALANQIVLEEYTVGLIGPFCSATTRGAAPILELNQVVMISATNTFSDLFPLGPTIFNRTVLPDPLFEPWNARIQGLASVREWNQKVALSLGHVPDAFMVHAYDAATLLLTRIEEVSEVDIGGNLVINRSELAEAVRTTDGFAGVTADITLNPFGDRLDTLVSWQDHFNSATPDPKWSWIREDPALWSLTERPGFLRLRVHRGAIQSTENPAKNLLVQEVPYANFMIQTRLAFNPVQTFQIAGLLVYQDDNNYLLFGRAYCDTPEQDCVGNGIYFDLVGDGEYSGENYAMTSEIPPNSTYLKLIKEEYNYTGWVSNDGLNWQLVGSHTSSLAFNRVGLATANGDQQLAEALPADFDFFLLDENTYDLYLPMMFKP